MAVDYTALPLPLLRRGKVRDIYELGDKLLMVASDRISAFDHVLPTPVPEKGRVLTLLSAFWFEFMSPLVPNHIIAVIERPEDLRPFVDFDPPEMLAGRTLVVARAEPVPVEMVVRGYLFGSAWEAYRRRGEVHGIKLPPGLREAEALPEPLVTPTTKAMEGHDRPLSLKELADLVGAELASSLEEVSLKVYLKAREYALQRGLILADTKMEFGFVGGRLRLIDELLTPDSSRFWALESYRPGTTPPSLDKQPVRDWLLASGWDRESPPPPLPPEVVAATSQRYKELYQRLTGKSL